MKEAGVTDESRDDSFTNSIFDNKLSLKEYGGMSTRQSGDKDACRKKLLWKRYLRRRKKKRWCLNHCFVCTVCRKKLSSPATLQLHELTHNTHIDRKLIRAQCGGKACSFCGKKYAYWQNLYGHMLTMHPLSCMSYSKQHNHVINVQQDTWNEWTVAKKTLHDQLLSTTDSVEENGFRYECTVCNKHFRCKSDAFHHSVMHVDRKLLPSKGSRKCEFCDAVFSRRVDLCYHLILGHPSCPAACQLRLHPVLRVTECRKMVQQQSSAASTDLDGFVLKKEMAELCASRLSLNSSDSLNIVKRKRGPERHEDGPDSPAHSRPNYDLLHVENSKTLSFASIQNSYRDNKYSVELQQNADCGVVLKSKRGRPRKELSLLDSQNNYQHNIFRDKHKTADCSADVMPKRGRLRKELSFFGSENNYEHNIYLDMQKAADCDTDVMPKRGVPRTELSFLTTSQNNYQDIYVVMQKTCSDDVMQKTGRSRKKTKLLDMPKTSVVNVESPRQKDFNIFNEEETLSAFDEDENLSVDCFNISGHDTSINVYVCEDCVQVFDDVMSLASHREASQRQARLRHYGCSHCGTMYRTVEESKTCYKLHEVFAHLNSKID